MLHNDLKKARLSAGLTMDQAAKRARLSQSTLSRIEAGSTGVTAQRLADLAAIYGVSPSQLLDGAVVRSMSESDLDRIGQVIEFVDETLTDITPRPSPFQIKQTVLAIYRQETTASWSSGATFDPTRYRALIETLLDLKR